MRPQWFNIRDIPYDHMWADDIHWYPLMFDGTLFEAAITLDGERVASHDIQIVHNFTEHA